MAIPTILFINDKEVKFTLSNRPEFFCTMDIGYYNKLMRGSNCYYIKEASRKGSPLRVYIARVETISGKRECIFLHWDVLGEEFRRPCEFVADHKNRDSLDNRKDNIRKASLRLNSRNRNYCTMGLSEKHDLPVDYTLSFRVKGSNKYFQAYYTAGEIPKYIKSSKDINIIRAAIKKHQDGK